MSRTLPRLSPILPYGLDLPFTAFTAASHGNYKFNYLSERGGAAMKFFEQPIYIHTHGTVRIPKDQYGKVTFSIKEDESAFVRLVEKDIMDNLDRIISMAEPSLNIQLLPFKSATYENLVKLRINKTVGQDKDGALVPNENHEDVLSKGVKVLMTLEIHGLYHSAVSKGVIARVHCYRVVDSFDA
jgi:hypothetical protein